MAKCVLLHDMEQDDECDDINQITMILSLFVTVFQPNIIWLLKMVTFAVSTVVCKHLGQGSSSA